MNEIAKIGPQAKRPVSVRIGQNVRYIMHARDTHQAQLAHELGITESQVSRRINGKVDWTPDDIEIVARVLGVSVGRLFTPLMDLNAEKSSQDTFGKLATVTPLFPSAAKRPQSRS